MAAMKGWATATPGTQAVGKGLPTRPPTTAPETCAGMNLASALGYSFPRQGGLVSGFSDQCQAVWL